MLWSFEKWTCHYVLSELQAPNNVPTYTLSGNSPAVQYFQVNPRTGDISLYRDLREDNATSYSVSNHFQVNVFFI